ncbi:MAG: hypothetical protein EOP06_02955 [Proteobacteria bacterium]|nr:MAG: hypothetical protein EOP06_02955 [Pseudomonadota bacterium]
MRLRNLTFLICVLTGLGCSVSAFAQPTDDLKLKKKPKSGPTPASRPPVWLMSVKSAVKRGPISRPAPASCSAIDYRKRFPPIRDQDSVGWCYAFTAADLITFKTGVNISPIDIAVSTESSKESYFQRLKGLFLSGDHAGARLTEDGDWAEKAINHAATKGFCREKDLPSDDYRYSQYVGNIKEILTEVGKLRKKAIPRTSRGAPFCFDKYKQYFPNITASEMADVLDSFSWRPLLDQMVDLTCKSRIKINGLEAKGMIVTSDSSASKLKNLNHILESGRPSGIGYNPSVIVDRDAKIEIPGGHDSSIVGRSWNGSECEYIVRNSWGPRCASADWHYRCERGYVFIPASKLIPAIGILYYVR